DLPVDPAYRVNGLRFLERDSRTSRSSGDPRGGWRETCTSTGTGTGFENKRRFPMRTKIDSPRTDGARAFLPDPFAHHWVRHVHACEPLAEALAEEYVASATSGEPATLPEQDAMPPEELRIPFLLVSRRRSRRAARAARRRALLRARLRQLI